VTAWTSSLAVIPASPSVQPESASAQKTLGTSGLSSQTEFDFFAPASASSRMSKATSPSDSERSLESWNKLVIQRRGEYSARLKSAHRTSASGSSSWPSPIASEVRQGFQDRSRGMKGSQESLTTVVVKDAANWLTPQSGDVTGSTQEAVVMWANGKRPKTSDQRLRTQVAAEQLKYGQAAQANPSTDGSRQGLSEQSQRNWQTFAHGTHNRGETPHRQVVKALVNGDKAKTQCLTVDQVFAEEIKGTNRPESWATPNAFCYQPPENTEKWTKRAEYQQTEKGVNLHKPIQTQVLHEVEKQWRTPSSSDGEGGVMEMREGCAGKYKLRDHVVAEQKSWATPIMGDSHLASTPEVAQKRIEEGKVTLSRQTAAWATPQLQDGHNINQDSTTHKTIPAQLTKMNMAGKLNPRWVETLMGLPVGWVMPSCASPVTIEQTNFDSSETESCLQPPSEHSELFGRNSND
jgi:hypothetical protein